MTSLAECIQTYDMDAANLRLERVKKFRQVYADSMECPSVDAMKVRQLTWRGERMPLADAAELYAFIPSYNEFKADMLPYLQDRFPDSGIEAVPARESSVAVYLFFPDGVAKQVMAFIAECFNADEVSVESDGSVRIWWD